jgi:hypothetical protein
LYTYTMNYLHQEKSLRDHGDSWGFYDRFYPVLT